MRRLSPDRWRIVSPYLDEALEIATTERAEWLAAVSARDPASPKTLVHLSYRRRSHELR